jgi:uncharacterized protein (UPF0335 family)
MADVIAADQLRLLIERVERLEEEKKALAEDIRDVYAEAKSMGYDVKTMRACVKLRKMEKHVRDEAEMLLDTYKAALGMDYSSTPLGAATIERATKTADVVKLAADIHSAGGRMVGGALVIPMDGLKDAAEARESDAGDDLYPKAVVLVADNCKASTSWLQRQLRIGYNQAARLVERMEREGLVSKPNNVGARTVLPEAATLAVRLQAA